MNARISVAATFMAAVCLGLWGFGYYTNALIPALVFGLIGAVTSNRARAQANRDYMEDRGVEWVVVDEDEPLIFPPRQYQKLVKSGEPDPNTALLEEIRDELVRQGR